MLAAVLAFAPTSGERVVAAAVSGRPVVRHDARADNWLVGSSESPLTVGFARDGVLVLQGVGLPDADGAIVPVADAPLVIDGKEVVLGDLAKQGVRFTGDTSDDYRGGVRLTLRFDAVQARAHVERHFVAYPGSAVVETWTEVRRLEADVPISVRGLAAWRVGVAGREVRWRRGLLMNEALDVAFGDESRMLGEGESLSFGGAGRSTETNLPWVTVRTPAGTFFGGLMWSGGWAIEATGDASATSVVARYDGGESTVPADGALEGVHGFFGVVAGGDAEISAAMRTFVVDGLRGGREFPALVSYNTWFVHGARIDESIVLREVAEAAHVGAELFQLDAGWYAGAGADGPYDFHTGLGSWKVDEERFPHGLRLIGDEARARGLRFGLWVEPERADLGEVGHDEGPREEWLATSDGLYRPGHANEDAGYAQVCLAHPDAWSWAFNHMVRLVEQQGVQYFVVDSNDWVNCTREGHGHGTSDGGFAHVQGLYRLLATLRERYPELLIENCAGGGNRLDLGLARVTDAGWMDDCTNPAVHVRHNLEQLSLFFPPSYLFSYVMPSQSEPMVGATDFNLLTRSRMPGVLGLSYRAEELGEAEYALLEHEVDVYKRARAISAKANAIVLTPSVSGSARPAWDVIEHVTPGGTSAVIYAFQNDGAAASMRVVPQGLAADVLFELESVDLGAMGTYRGSLLMSDGFELKGSPNTAAHVVFVRPRDASAATRLSRAR